MAIDLGTVNTVVYVRGKGIVLNEPSVVALEYVQGVRRVKAVGRDAKLMMGKTPASIQTIRPLRDGVIADIDVAEQMIKHFIHKAHGGASRLPRFPEIVICVPSGSTSVERRAIRDAATNAGASKVWLIEEPMAAAIGADLPVLEPIGAMVVDIGGGTTEVAVLSLRGLAYSTSVRGRRRQDGRCDLRFRPPQAQSRHRRSDRRADQAQAWHCPCPSSGDTKMMRIRGRHLSAGMPKEIAISDVEVAEAIHESVSQIVGAVRSALESTPPELSADIIDRGIILTGGGAMLQRMDEALSLATGLPVAVAEDPLNCVALGAGRALEDADYRGVLAEA
jgi:rod shape-determining protein MreB